MSTTTLATPAPAHAVAAPAAVAKTRISSIDVMRGLVMVIMLVDHVREKLYLHLQVTDPMTIDVTTPDLFFTRLAAHLCAPVFVFLTGLSAWLYAHPASGEWRSPSEFLFKRGLFLIVLEVTLVNFAWSGTYNTLWLQVIWVIGLSMIVLAGMVHTPRWLIASVGALIVFGHNLLTPISFQPGETGYTLWSILHDRNVLIPDGPLVVKVTYPVLPWIGVILLGYTAGPLYGKAMDPANRARLLRWMGTACLLLLLVLRGFNIYGETLPWQHYDETVKTVMSFLNYTKYPPSLDFLLLTLGISFFLMPVFEKTNNVVTRALQLYGGAPMFFYLLHLYVLLVGYRILLAIFGPTKGALFGVDDFYWVWITAAILATALYYPTAAFSRFKRRSKQAWVRYF